MVEGNTIEQKRKLKKEEDQIKYQQLSIYSKYKEWH